MGFVGLVDDLGARSGSVRVSAACTPPSDMPYMGVALKRFMLRRAIMFVTWWAGPLGSGAGTTPPAYPAWAEYALGEDECELAFEDRPQPGPGPGAWTWNCGGGTGW